MGSKLRESGEPTDPIIYRSLSWGGLDGKGSFSPLFLTIQCLCREGVILFNTLLVRSDPVRFFPARNYLFIKILGTFLNVSWVIKKHYRTLRTLKNLHVVFASFFPPLNTLIFRRSVAGCCHGRARREPARRFTTPQEAVSGGTSVSLASNSCVDCFAVQEIKTFFLSSINECFCWSENSR